MKKAFWIAILLGALQGLIHNIGHPVTPAMVTALGIPDFMFGVFFASMAAGMTLGGFFFGALGDSFEKRKLIFWGLLVYSLGQLGFGILGNMIWMSVARFVGGFGVAGIVTLLISYMIENSPKDKRATNLAILSATITLFASIGYKLGGWLSSVDWMISLFHTDNYQNVFVVLAVWNFFFAFLVLFVMRESKQHVSQRRVNPISALKGLKDADPSMVIFLFAVMFISMGSINLGKYIDVYFNTLGYSPSQLGTFVMTTGFVSIFASLVLVPLIIKFKKELSVMMLIQLLSVGLVLISFHAQPFLALMYSVYLVYVALRAIYAPYEQNFLSDFAKDGQMSLVMGVRQSFLSFGMIIGPVAGGLLYEISPTLVFDVSAAMFLIGFLLFLIVFSRQKRKGKAET